MLIGQDYVRCQNLNLKKHAEEQLLQLRMPLPGTTQQRRKQPSISNSGLTNETALPDTANANYNSGIQGPLRVGKFARSSSTQARAGATYDGIMEMSGGVWERIVTVGDATGRGFTGTHGDGVLGADGNATGVSSWPGTDAVGSGFRGGVWDSPDTYMRISDRGVAALASSVRGGNSDNVGTRGFRAVRTAP